MPSAASPTVRSRRAPGVATRRGARVGLAGRALALTMAMLLVIVATLEGHHQATTRHLRCVEHGDVIHGAESARAALEGAEAGDGHIAAVAAHAPMSGIRTRTAGDPRAEHDHCSFPPAVTARVDAPPAIAAVAHAPVVARIAAFVARAEADGRGAYRGAPKTSPPVA